MTDVSLDQKHTGELLVIVSTLAGDVEHWKWDDNNATLFEYIGHACVRIFTNMTTYPVIRTRPADWKIINFSPEEGILEAEQIDGEPLTLKEDNTKRLKHFQV